MSTVHICQNSSSSQSSLFSNYSWLRERGNASTATLLEKAREARRSRVPDEGAGVDQDLDGSVAVARDPRKYCWMCHTPDHVVKLMVCTGCKRVRYTFTN